MAQPPVEHIPLTPVGANLLSGPSGAPAQNLASAGGPTNPQPGPSGNEAPTTPHLGANEASLTSPLPQLQVSTTGASTTPADFPTQIAATEQEQNTNITTPSPNPQAPALPVTNVNQPNHGPAQANGATPSSNPSPPNQPQKKTTFIGFCWSMKGPLSLMAVYPITTYIIGTASDVNGPLARCGVTGGFLLLNILAILNNYALLAAGDKAWESTQWSRNFMQSGQNLTDFLALSTGSGVPGWLRIVFHDLQLSERIWKKLPEKVQRIWGALSNIVPWKKSVSVQAGPGSPPQIPRPPMTKARFWGLSRIGFWLLVQFPALIFMTKVNTGIDYRPTEWEDISGGVGEYNASLAALKLSNGAYLSGLALNMIRDVTITKKWPAVTQECKEKSNCASYIIPGGLKTVAPWRYLTENGSTLPVYMTRGTPVYQLDFWDGPFTQWAEKDCTLFGMYGTTGLTVEAFQICMTPYEDRKILTAFKYCNDNVTSDGSCTYEDSWRRAATWNVVVAVYRRNATVSIERKTGELLDVKNLTKAEPQDITPAEFLTAFNGILYPFKALNVSFACDATGNEFQLTRWISTVLSFSRVALYQVEPREILRNLFMVPLYFYNPITSPLGPLPSVTEKVEGLPSENYILGSFSHKVNLLTITWWTILTYIVVCGMILLLILLVLAMTALNQVQETSDFPFVDFLTLKKETATAMPNGSGGAASTQDDMATIFTNCAYGESGDIIEASRGVRILPPEGARTSARARNTLSSNVV